MKQLFLASAFFVSAQAASANVDASNPARLFDLLRSEGYAVELGTDNVGDPKITAKYEGTKFEIFFYDCTNNADCRTIQFQVGYDLRNGMELSKANQWNAEMRYGATYLDDEMDPYLQMDVNIDYGVSEANFVDQFKMWTNVMGQFEDYIDW